jgi:long-chain acyl-CoA synthetase
MKDYPSLHAMLEETVAQKKEQAAYRWFVEGGGTESVTWAQFLEQVHQASKSLMALGVKHGDNVNILSYSCYRWVLTDFAISSIGSCTVGIYQSNLPKDCKYIINHSDAVLAFVENEEQLAKLMEIRAEIPAVRKVIMFSGQAPADDWVISYEEFLALGKDVPDDELRRRINAVTPQDPACIVYTSGTTGVPKGAVLTHDAMCFTPQSARGCLEVEDGDETLLFLPLAHVFARICVLAAMLTGSAVTFARGIPTVAEDLRASRPHWFPSVPRIYEKVYAKVISGAEAKGGLALKIFRWACRVGAQVSERKQAKQPVGGWLGFKYKIASKLVFSKLHAALGGRLRWCISGAAPLTPEIARFFHSAGILILEGIGMTENCSFTNVNRVDNYRFGWVGLPGPGIEQKIGEDGEVLYRGRNLMKEYYKMPTETTETISEDGWLHTGDLGEIDGEGFLKITGRKKDLIITAGGKNVAPSPIEGLMGTSKYINQVCVVGDRRKFLSALVTLDPETVPEYAKEQGIAFSSIAELQGNPQVVELINGEIAARNKQLASYEAIKKITIVDEFTIENGMLTPTMKVKRNIAMEHHKALIEAMYAG